MICTITRYRKTIACSFFWFFYLEWLLLPVTLLASTPGYRVVINYTSAKESIAAISPVRTQQFNVASITNKIAVVSSYFKHRNVGKDFSGGPTQPEMQAFSSVNANNMVDLFSGDFAYNIPLMDVGGYPVNLSYRGGVTMDQEASWVGLGWNINPGTITRNMRGLPDDFDGKYDSVKKTMNVRENKTVGVTAGGDAELVGFPLTVGASIGVLHNSYKGWGLEHSVNASISAGAGGSGTLTAGLSLTNNSQDGLTVSPSLSAKFASSAADENSGALGTFSVGGSYNSRSGMKGLQMSAGIQQYGTDAKNQLRSGSSSFSTNISFASPTFTPTITIPLSSQQFTFTAKVGFEEKIFHPDLYVSGYVSKQSVAAKDTSLSLPAYGYMHYQDGSTNASALTDFNREKEIPYREKPAVPHIAVPTYTYDAFSITGEGTGGMFRPYRSDIGYIHDPFVRTRDASGRLSVDLGVTDLLHLGVDLNVNRAFTQSGPWIENNPMANVLAFKKSDLSYESVYFRNPGEKSINSKQYYEALGGDDVVAVNLFQPSVSSSVIQTTNYLTRYKNKRDAGKLLLTPQSTIKMERDKRTQVISYLNAADADAAGLSKYIESYNYNQFTIATCNSGVQDAEGNGTGLPAVYYMKNDLSGIYIRRTDPVINFDWGKDAPPVYEVAGGFPADNFSIHWEGRVKAPKTGMYVISMTSDDGARLWVNDSLVKNHWNEHPAVTDTVHLNLIAGEFYKIKMEYFELGGNAVVKLFWTPPGQAKSVVIPQAYLYAPAIDTFSLGYMVKEKRVNTFRKPNHISEIDVLNNDGRRYVYGIPVYNLKQEESTFAIDTSKENKKTGFVAYADTLASTRNKQGKDWYFNREDVPAYAHSFLLTGILSSDYVDATGNGISDDDMGDAVKFNYSKVCGIANPYQWRTPYTDSASLNVGLKTYNRDDKGNFVYGEKELWYLHSISSKTMIATFTVEDRLDLRPINRAGQKQNASPAKRLKEINLYSKAEFLQKGTSAKPIKTVHFEYSYQLCTGVSKNLNDSGKLTLKKVWFTYNNNQKGQKNPYVFHYSNTNPAYNTRAYDRWGNYKDPLQNPGSTSAHFIGNDDYPYALQDSATAAVNASAWTMDSIYLPSGGSMKIDMESDDYAFVQNKRAVQPFKLAGLGPAPNMTTGYSDRLYTSAGDNLYVYIKVNSPVASVKEVYQKYLKDIKKLYFKLSVTMPGDIWGNGNELVPCYTDIDTVNGYGMVNSSLIWVKTNGISLKGDDIGKYSPLAKAATQFLRLNLSSQAYPNSEIGDNLDLENAVKIIFSMADNITNAFTSFDSIARANAWASQIDTSRTWVRLNSPAYKKYGGGHRVKRITIYDNWDKMTQQRAAVYGQEYTYTTKKEINGAVQEISSGVASYEPGIGADENPLHVPIEYVEKIAPLGPVTLGYTEEPLGESLFPSAGIGYSKVRVRTINYNKVKSANGFAETQFYTAYDFPVFTDRTVLDNDTKKRFKPTIANLLRINAKHHVVLSQGFKVELNDMHGKLRSQATYSETDPTNPTTYTENIYKVEDPTADNKRLSNTAMIIGPDGTIDSAAVIGKDAELMVDMREQKSVTNAYNVNINSELFTVPSPLPPFFLLPSLLNLAQREETIYRSAAVTKVIQRYGIIDSVLHIDKGSKISTKDIVYDSETGDALVTRTQNEFNDPVYSFNYPSHWAYDGMGLAYKNIGTIVSGADIKNGRIIKGLTVVDTTLFTGGDELIVAGKQKTGTGTGCTDTVSTFPVIKKIWAVDSSSMTHKAKAIYFVDSDGKPYTGTNVSLNVVRSGRRNLLTSVGGVTSLDSIIRRNSSGYQLVLNTASKITSASSDEFREFWQVEDRKKKLTTITCYPDTTTRCNDTIPAVLQDSTVSICFSPSLNPAYTQFYSTIYKAPGDTIGVNIGVGNGFWTNSSGNNGRLNATGVWTCGGCTLAGQCGPGTTWLGFSKAVYIPATDTMFIGMGGDNQVRVTVDKTVVIDRLQRSGINDDRPFKIWHIFPLKFTQGYHEIKVEGWNVDNGSDASFGAEIYNLTRAQLLTVDSNTVKSHTIFSTVNAVDHSYTKGLSCPADYNLDTTFGHSYCIKTIPCAGHCDTVVAANCKSVVTDTIFNPYIAGVLGNWRSNKAYTYYGLRTETDPSTATNLRKNGTFADFTAFWNFTGGKLSPVYDSTRWVWNSEKTLFNRKGMEVENKDPLGRYNAGLYGYNLTMPTAVIQNAHYRENAFEGFEDYGFATQVCDTGCAAARHMDFSSYKGKLDATVSHTGIYSIKLNKNDQASVGFSLLTAADDSMKAIIKITTQTDACPSTGTMLKDMKITNKILLPIFSPTKGQRMVFSAWVKEDRDCKGATYDSNQVVIALTGGTNQNLTLKPSGNIIEGWQRYESFFDIPANDTSIAVSLRSTGSAAVYFDDVRLHPFNANMKSFVFNPVNLRLMAELDENNYATYYEYDDDGTLIRVKKETERGIKTIKETRSALIKQ